MNNTNTLLQTGDTVAESGTYFCDTGSQRQVKKQLGNMQNNGGQHK